MGRVSRRDLLKTAAGVGTVALRGSTGAQGAARPVRVAAVQMHAALGEVAANLENAEHWVRLAIREGARGSSCRNSSRRPSPSIRRSW